MNSRIHRAALAAVGLALALPAAPAGAAFPGQNGRIVYSGNESGDNDVWSIDPDGSGKVNLTNDPSTDDWADAVSPDGRLIAFGRETKPGHYSLFVMNADGTGQRELATRAGFCAMPAFSPDGKQIAFAKLEGGDREIYVVNVDGTGLHRVAGAPKAIDTFPSWSTKGLIAFTRYDPQGGSTLYTVEPDGTGLKQLTPRAANAGDPEWSPDGKWIAFSNNQCSTCPNSDIVVMRADGTRMTQLTSNMGHNVHVTWSPDGEKLLYMHQTSFDPFTNWDLFVMDRDGSSVVNFTATPDWGEGGARWAPLVH
jgi:Tol biopolymer transport system component